MPKPKVIVHSEVSADGRIDWFRPHEDVYYGLLPTWNEDATLTGIETVFDPRTGVPREERPATPPKADPSDTRPLLVVTDSRGRGYNWQHFREWPYTRDVLVLVSSQTPESYIAYLKERYVEHIVAGHERVDLGAALLELNRRHGVRTVRTDSGGTLNGALLRAGLVDEISLLVAPSLVGGMSPRSFFRAPDLESPEGVVGLRLFHVEKLRHDVVWLRYEVARPTDMPR
jgi:2,5-diamino-6-(ribosylamino)-4(3H)-pyrimidinone 5'-phosphate reductase